MKPNETLLGVQSPGDELVIRGLSRIERDEEIREGLFDGTAGPVVSERRKVWLDAWSGETGTGLPVHVAYRFGELTIQVDLPTADSRCPLTVLRWKPRYALELAADAGPFGAARMSRNAREERARLAEAAAELAEIRALNAREPRTLSEGELRWWLAERNRHFAFLSGRGLAGGMLRFRIVDPPKQQTKAA